MSRGVPLCRGASGAGALANHAALWWPPPAAAPGVSASPLGGRGGVRPSPRVPECLPLGMQVTWAVSGPQALWRRQTDTHTQMGRMVSSSLGRPGGGLHSPWARAGPVPWVGVVRDPQFHPSSRAWTHCCQEVLTTLQVSHPRCSLFPQIPPEGVREACWIPEMPPSVLRPWGASGSWALWVSGPAHWWEPSPRGSSSL